MTKSVANYHSSKSEFNNILKQTIQKMSTLASLNKKKSYVSDLDRLSQQTSHTQFGKSNISTTRNSAFKSRVNIKENKSSRVFQSRIFNGRDLSNQRLDLLTQTLKESEESLETKNEIVLTAFNT